MSVTKWRATLVVAVVLVWCISVAVTLADLPAGTARLLDDLAQLLISAMATVATGYSAVRHRGRQRQGWAALAVACGGWTAGQTAWATLELARGDNTPFPSVADIGYLIFPIAFGVAIWLFPSERPRLRRRDVLDGLVVAAGLASFTWTTTLIGILESNQLGPVALAVSLAYPVGDAIVLVMAMWACSRAVTMRDTLTRLCLSLVAMTISDSAFAYLTATGSYATGSAASFGWTACFTGLTVAALRGSERGVAVRQPVRTVDADQAGGLLPYLPLMAAFTATAVSWIVTHRTDLAGPALLALTVVLTLLRGRIALQHNESRLAAATERTVELERQGSVDTLTGLINRRRFCELLEAALVQHRSQQQSVTVVVLDLDHFTTVNDGLGRDLGDQALVHVAARLAGRLLEGEALARLDSDEFVVLAAHPGDGQQPRGAELTRRLRGALAEPLVLAGHRLSVQASFGICALSARQATPSVDQMLAQADIAMRVAKRSQSGASLTWHDGLTLPEAGDWHLRPMLEDGMARGEIVPWYQPVVDLTTGRLIGFEALARWQQGEHTMLPSNFLPVAARAGLMPYLTRQVMRQAAAQLTTWRERPGLAEQSVAVNVPPSLIIDPTFPDTVAAVLAEFRLPAGGLVLEITEEALLTDLGMASRVTRRLRSMGVLLALDDFGAGYSSLMHLHRLPLDRLKIDQGFVQSVDSDPDGRRLMRGLLGMCRDLDLRVIAEGIERPSQARALQDLGCELGQGYLIAEARSALNIEPLLQRVAAGMEPAQVPLRTWQDRSA